MLCLKIVGWLANSVDPDEMLQNGASDLSTLFAKACLSEYVR